jgi:hypothetical protein
MHFEIDFLESHDEASLVGEMQRIAVLLGKRTVTAKEIDRLGRVNSRTIMQKFGTLRKAHEAAGLVASRYTKSTDEELMRVVADVWILSLREAGRRPRMSEVKKYGFPVSSRTIVQRFGTWKGALMATAKRMALPGAGHAVVAEAPVVKKRQPISDHKRFVVLKRDGYCCRICHKAGGELEVDHVVPVSLGGSDLLENLQTLCKRCNRGKGGNME